MQSLWQDLRYGMRGIRANPGFSFLAILTLALGIGAGTTMFSVIKNVLLSPFPYKDPEQIAAFNIHDLDRGRPGGQVCLKAAEYLEFRQQNHVFSGDTGGGNEDVLWTTGVGTEQLDGAYVTPDTFQFLGVSAQVGRGLTPEDGKPGAPPVFVMSYKMWQQRFSLDPTILGRSFTLNGTPTTLVGIMPKRFTKRGADIWRPAELDRADTDRWFIYQGRLKPGVTLKQVEADLLPIAQRWAKDHPKDYPKRFSIEASSYVDSIVGPFRKTLFTLGAAVALLLLIACANVANMLLARSTARDREMAIRAALGASRWRVVRQLLVESLLLALGGAVLGCGFAYAGIKALVTAIPDGAIPQEAEIGLDLPVLVFSLGLTIFTALLFGLAPALQLARRNIVEPLKDSGRGVSGGFRRGRLRNALVIVELALSLVLLTGAGVMMRTFVALQTVDLGFNPHNILVARLPFPKGQYKTAAEKQRFFGQLLPKLKALPGVVEATETSTLPPYGGIPTDVEITGKTHTDRWQAIYQLVSEGYCRTLGARLLHGRLMEESEVAGARKVAVVNQTLVTKWFGKEDPIGRQITIKHLGTIPNSAGGQPGVRNRRRDQRHEEFRSTGSGAAGNPGALHGHRRLRARNSGAHGGQPGRPAQSGAARDLGGGQERRAHHDAHAGRFPQRLFVRAAALPAGGARRLRRRRAGAGGGGRVQRDRVHGLAADAGDRDPDGAGREPRRRDRHGAADGAVAGRDRAGGGSGGEPGGKPGARERTVGRQRARSADLRGGRAGGAGGGCRGVLVPGAARHAGGPDDRAALRVTAENEFGTVY